MLFKRSPFGGDESTGIHLKALIGRGDEMGFNYYKFCSARSPDESLMKFDDLQRCPNEAQNLDISYVGWKVATLCKIFMCTVHTVHA